MVYLLSFPRQRQRGTRGPSHPQLATAGPWFPLPAHSLRASTSIGSVGKRQCEIYSSVRKIPVRKVPEVGASLQFQLEFVQ